MAHQIDSIIRKGIRSPKFTPIPMDRQLPDGDWSTSGRVNSCKVSPMVGHPGLTSLPSSAWKKADIFKLNGDDDDIFAT